MVLLADLGVSSHHFDAEERRIQFPFRCSARHANERTGRDDGSRRREPLHGGTVGQRLLPLRRNEEQSSFGCGHCQSRGLNAISTIDDLLQIVRPLMPREREKKDLARVFQALRIEVNHEMDALHEMLDAAQQVIRPGGRLVVLTYHSLEDRMVKNFIKAGRTDGKVEQDFFGRRLTPWRAVNNKVILPSEQEQEENPRSRSAKLRIAERVELPEK